MTILLEVLFEEKQVSVSRVSVGAGDARNFPKSHRMTCLGLIYTLGNARRVSLYQLSRLLESSKPSAPNRNTPRALQRPWQKASEVLEALNR